MDILFDDECKHLGADLDSKPNIELCTGKRKKFPKIEVYTYNMDHGFNLTGIETDYLGIKTDYDFYIGGTDSCQGKSKICYDVMMDRPFKYIFLINIQI